MMYNSIVDTTKAPHGSTIYVVMDNETQKKRSITEKTFEEFKP